MSKWQKFKLGEIGVIITGNTPKTSDKENYFTNDIPFYKPSDIVESNVSYLNISEAYVSEVARSKVRILPKGSILVTCIGIIGKIGILEHEATCNQQINAIIPDQDICLNRYIAYSIFFNRDRLRDIANAPVVPIVNKTQFSNMIIPIPPLEEQRRIADILDKASNLIDLRKQQLKKMDLLIKSKFIDMFGDPVTNPKGWEIQRIEELCEAIFGGGTPSKSNAEYYDGDIPWVTSKDMKSILISDSIDHINDKAVLNSSAKYIPKQSLLMVIRSGILKHTLPLGINTRVVTINQDMKAFIPNANINVWVMFYTFKMHEKSLLNNVRAVTADNIEFSIIRNLMVPVPSLELQNQFAEFVEQVEKQKVVMQQSLGKMEMNYKALMQEYFG